MLNVNDQLPTSTLLAVKVGAEIKSDQDISGMVKHIEIEETDEFLQFLFVLDNDALISVRKLKQIC